MKTTSLLIILMAFLSNPFLYAESDSPEVKPLLKPDPAVLKIIKNLGENCSALLPQVKTAGHMDNPEVKRFKMDKSGPRPRDYCLKWVWAEDRKRALFCGGNAGVPHKLNDVWEYDLASNTWILLWEPDPDTNRARHMKKPEEAKSYLDKFVIVDEESGEAMRNPVDLVIRGEEPTSRGKRPLLLRKDGKTVPIAETAGAMIRAAQCLA